MTNILKAITSLNRLNQNLILPSISMSKRHLSSPETKTVQTVNGLPKLPVPAVNQTKDRLKLATKPFAKSEQELDQLYGLIDDFFRPDGTAYKLNSLLEHKSNKTTNWLSNDWWINKVYLEPRYPVMIWSNPGLVFPDLQILKKTPNKQFVVQFISRLILSAIDFRNSLRNGINPEISPKADPKSVAPVCMDQYNKVFGTCRIPGNPVDSIRIGNLETNEISIIISRNNKFYKISLNESDYEVLLQKLQTVITHILSKNTTENIPFGIFSALPRNDFSTVFQLLDENSVNSIIESQFVVNIDHIEDIADSVDNESYYNLMAKQSLFSDINNIGNRWFDKTIQLIVVMNKSSDRVIGCSLCYEHTPAEGGTIVKLMEHCVQHIMSDKTQLGKQLGVSVDIETLPMVSNTNSDKVKASAEFAKQKYLDFINSVDLEILEFRDYGKEFIKSVKCSPDSWIQLAIALTFYRLHKKVGATYESGGTRKFAFGRTETIRSVSNEFVEFFKNSNFQNMINAIESHKVLAKNAVNGHGIDRILLGKYSL